MSRIASSNLFDILGEDEAPEEVVVPKAAAPAAASAKGAGKQKPVAAAVPAQAAPAKSRANEPAKDAPAEDPAFNRQNRGGSPQKGRPPRENTKNDRHVSRNGSNRDISKGGGGRGNWGDGIDENRPQGPNSKKIADEPITEPEAIAAAPDAEAPAAAAPADGAPAADAPVGEPEKPKEPDPADKFIGLDEFFAQKEAKRVAEDNNIKIREVIVDEKQFKHIKVAVSEKDHVENDFSDLKVAKKGKKEKAANKRAQTEAIDLYPVGVVNNGAPAPRFDRPQGDRPPRADGEFRGSGRGGFRGRGRGGQRPARAPRGTNLRDEDFPSLVGAAVQ